MCQNNLGCDTLNCLAYNTLVWMKAVATRVVTDRQTHTHTHTPLKYHIPHCACTEESYTILYEHKDCIHTLYMSIPTTKLDAEKLLHDIIQVTKVKVACILYYT